MYTFRNKTGSENKENFFIKYRNTKHTDELAFSRLTSNELELYLKSWECKYVIKDRILSEMRQSVFLQQEALKSQSDEDWRAYMAAQNRVRLQISEVKRELWTRILIRHTPAQRICGNA